MTISMAMNWKAFMIQMIIKKEKQNEVKKTNQKI